MSSPSYYLAIDLGAESGRVMLGTLRDGHLTLEELHRFSNGAVVVKGSRRWDLLHLYAEIVQGLRNAGARGLPIRSLSTDSWGVDYTLMQGSEPFLAPPYQYRDERTDGSYERLGDVTHEQLYKYCEFINCTCEARGSVLWCFPRHASARSRWLPAAPTTQVRPLQPFLQVMRKGGLILVPARGRCLASSRSSPFSPRRPGL